jgi:hypothetical protein
MLGCNWKNVMEICRQMREKKLTETTRGNPNAEEYNVRRTYQVQILEKSFIEYHDYIPFINNPTESCRIYGELTERYLRPNSSAS